jgi:uncharacterized membrane protein
MAAIQSAADLARSGGLPRVLLAITLAAMGISGLIHQDFPAIWQPVAAGVPLRGVLVCCCVAISLGCGVGLLLPRTLVLAGCTLLLSLVAWLLAFRLPALLRMPGAVVAWEGCSETAVIIAGAWMVYSRSPRGGLPGFAGGSRGVRCARILYALALIPFGLAHLAYVGPTAALVPGWLPAHAAWAIATGVAYILAGIAILTGVLAGLAAALSSWQMGLFTLLVWVPILAAGSRDPFHWSETWLSWTLTLCGWLVAHSWRGESIPADLDRPAKAR